MLNDFNFISIKLESVIISRIDIGFGFALPEPFRLTTGIYDADPWLSLPSGIEVEYLLPADKRIGGSPSEFISQFYFPSSILLYFT